MSRRMVRTREGHSLSPSGCPATACPLRLGLWERLRETSIIMLRVHRTPMPSPPTASLHPKTARPYSPDFKMDISHATYHLSPLPQPTAPTIALSMASAFLMANVIMREFGYQTFRILEG